MKKVWFVLAAGLFFIGTNLFAANGDLIVNNKVGAGTASPNERVTVNGVLSLSELTEHPIATTGYGKLYVVLSPGEQVTENDKLILHMDGADESNVFTDSSSFNHAVTAVGNARISTTQSQSGGASGYFDGNGAYLSLADSEDWNLGSENFTIDFWIYPEDISRTQSIITQSNGNGYTPIAPQIQTNGTLTLWASTNCTSWDIASNILAANLTQNVWTHIAIVRNGNNLFTFQDGVLKSTTNVSNKTFANSDGSVYMGAVNYSNCGLFPPQVGNSCQFFKGYIDEFRISKGVVRWNGNFTPPSAPYEAKPRLYFKDSAGNVTQLTN